MRAGSYRCSSRTHTLRQTRQTSRRAPRTLGTRRRRGCLSTLPRWSPSQRHSGDLCCRRQSGGSPARRGEMPCPLSRHLDLPDKALLMAPPCFKRGNGCTCFESFLAASNLPPRTFGSEDCLFCDTAQSDAPQGCTHRLCAFVVACVDCLALVASPGLRLCRGSSWRAIEQTHE